MDSQMRQRLFVDMDGTLAVFRPVDEMETLYEEGYFLLNGINHTRGSWPHDRLSHEREPRTLASCILSIMRDERQIFDEKQEGKASVLDNLRGKQKQISEGGHEKSGKQRGEKEWQI